MTLGRPALVIAVLTLLGCEQRTEELTGAPRPRPRLSMAPRDLTSAVGAIPLQVLVDNSSKAVGRALLEPIAAQVGLVSWPEGTPVPFATQLQEFVPRREDGYDVFGSGTITVTPGAALEDRWYFLYVSGAPTDVEVAGAMQMWKLADGRAGVRFTLVSDPRMTWVRRCPGELPSGKVVVDFSEPVVLESAEALAVEGAGTCARPLVGNDADRIGSSFSFMCDGIASSTPIRVVVASTVTGTSGRPVRGAGLPTELAPAAFEPGGECQVAVVATE